MVETNNTSVLIPTSVPEQSGILFAISKAYSILTSNPTALILFLVSSLSIIAESNNQEGPFELMAKVLKQYISDTNHPAFLITLASMLLALVNAVIRFKNPIFLTMMILTIPLSYPFRSTNVTVILLLAFCLLSTNSTIVSALIIQAVFVYYSLDSITDKIVVICVFVYLIVGADSLSKFFTTAN
nr:MAG: ORF4 protein [Riboviria sp.]